LKKIGILLESSIVNKYLYDTVRQLAQSGQIDFYFLINSQTPIKPGLWNKIKFFITTQDFWRFVDISFFALLTAAEHAILSPFSNKIRTHHQPCDLKPFNKNAVVRLHPVFSASGRTVHYPETDIDQIRSLGLDMIVRGNAPGIFKGDILDVAREGIISFHHGDNRWNRGGPPGFWEVYFKNPSTGFIIQILTEELDGGRVLFRGNIPTMRSYTENVVNLYNESNPYLAELLLNYAKSNHLPPAEEKFPFAGVILQIPSFYQSIVYSLRSVCVYTFVAITELVLRRRQRWSVAFVKNPWCHVSLRQGVEIKNPAGRYFADPFVITKEGRTICFVEDCSCRSKVGRITAIEIMDGKNYNILGPVIAEPFHLSFPFLLEYEQELYMVPETAEVQAIRLYRCVEFPMKWEYVKDIKSNVNAGDSVIFKHKDKWWLFSNIGTQGSVDHCSTLMAYFSESPLSDEWQEHKLNPLVFDCRMARNGGLLDGGNGCLVRVRQRHGYQVYGESLTLAKITELTPSSFEEKEFGQIHPDFFKGIIATHHMHSDGHYTVYDYARWEAWGTVR